MNAYTACFAGPRPEKLMPVWNDADPAAMQIKTELRREIRRLAESEGYTFFLTGMARGIDLIAAETVLELQKDLPFLALGAVIPYREQGAQQASFWRERYEAVLEHCSLVSVLQERYTSGCLLKRNRYMIDRSSRLIAVTNGDLKSGTAAAIRYAERRNVPCTLIRTKLSAGG